MFYGIIPTAGTETAPAALIVCYDNSFLCFCDILPVPRRQWQSLSRSPLSGIHPAAVSFSPWESHPRALARTLSCKYHHSSRLSSPAKGALYPSGRTFSFLWLADLSAAEVLYRINWYEDGEPSCLSKISLAQPVTKNTIAGCDTLQRLIDWTRTAF